MENKKNFALSSSPAKGLRRYDWAIFAALAIVSFVSLQQADILHTGGSAFAYLDGHIFDFYDYNAQFGIYDAYFPSTYILFAIWNIPIRLLGWAIGPTLNVGFRVVMWYKLLPTLFYFASGWLMYKISLEMGMGALKAKICMYAFMTAPLAFFSQFIFGQYDVFTVFFILLGFYFWCRGDLLKFCLLFGVAITFKFFAFLFFVPLFFLREKRFQRIFLGLFLAVLPILIETALYIRSPGFRNGIFANTEVSSYIFKTFLTVNGNQVSLVVVVWLMICAYAYFCNPENGVKELQWAIFLCSIVCFACFGMSIWHPQWLLIMVPFMTLGMLSHKRADVFCIIDVLVMLFFVIFTVNVWPNNVDQTMLNLGIFKHLVANRLGGALTMREILVFRDTHIAYTCFSALMLISVWFKHPKYLEEDFSKLPEHFAGWLRLRFLAGVSFFLIPAFICLFSAINAPLALVEKSDEMATHIGPVAENTKIEQYFSVEGTQINQVGILFGTYQRKNEGIVTVTIADADTKEPLAAASKDLSTLPDNLVSHFKFDDIPVNLNQGYLLTIDIVPTTANDVVTLFRTSDNTATDTSYAKINDVAVSFNFCVDIYGEQ